MVYRVISILCGEVNVGFELGFAEVQEEGGNWSTKLSHNTSIPFALDIKNDLLSLQNLNGKKIFELHRKLGQIAGNHVKDFISINSLQFKVGLIGFNGFANEFTARYPLGDGGALAAITKLPVVSDLSTMDIAMGGSGTSGKQLAVMAGSATSGLTSIAVAAVLRWREEINHFSNETGSTADTVGGALWMGSGE